MKRWLVLSVVVVALVAAGFTARYWLAPLLQTIGAKSELIQGLQAALQIVLWIAAGAVGFWGWFRRPRTLHGGEGNVNIMGERNTVVQTGIYIEKHEISEKAPTTDATALRLAYLNRVFETSRQLPLEGVDPKAAGVAVDSLLKLDAVYTALLTESSEEHEKWLFGKIADRQARKLSAVEQLQRNHRLVLLGDPGSGKSTFVNFVALCLAGETLGKTEANLALLTAPLPSDKEEKDEQPPQPWTHGPLLPVRVILRDFAARGLPPAGAPACADDLWRFIVLELAQASLADFAPILRQHLLDHGGLLLLDGLDEVPEAEQRREQIKQAIEDFARTFHDCHLLVSSRTYAYQKQEWRLSGFVETVLAAFNPAQIRAFVDRWYQHVALMRGQNLDDAKGRAVLLKNAIFGSDRLFAFAERPLLLTLMASLHAWRGGSLPEKRHELYAEAVDLLLEWWESPKVVREKDGAVTIRQPSLAEWLQVDKQKVRELLDELAFAAHSAQPDLVGTADIPEKELAGRLFALKKNPAVKLLLLVEYLSQRAGLLLPRGVGVYTFAHRTFQEYLAACHLTAENFPDTLAELVRHAPDRWREVALLAAAKAAAGAEFAVWAFAEALCDHDLPEKPGPVADLWCAHLAGQALAEAANLTRVSSRDQAKLARVKSWLLHILARADFPARERALAGDTLARLGDQRDAVTTVEAMEFCCVPAGPFWMGSDEYDDEKPPHLNTHLDYDYWLGCFPVTVAQYRVFVEDSGHKPTDSSCLKDLPSRPVRYVTWHEAVQFCGWLTGRWREAGLLPKGWQVTLPSEAEWEKAARGGLTVPVAPVVLPIATIVETFRRNVSSEKTREDTIGVETPRRGVSTAGNMVMVENDAPQRRYPWGNNGDANRANYADTQIGTTSAVGCFFEGRSRYGCEELSGNVWEWTRSLWGKDFSNPEYRYPYDPGQGNREDLTASDAILRVLRGGSFPPNDNDVRCANRISGSPDFRNYGLGFRVVVCVSPSL